jgi:predicted RNase H-like HicB family nuclease
VLERDEDGVVIATAPALPGCHIAGDTEEEALALVQDAIALHIEARRESGEPAGANPATNVQADMCYDPSWSISERRGERAPVLPEPDIQG